MCCEKDDDEKDQADVTPQKLAEDLELEVLLRNEQNLILNSLSDTSCEELSDYLHCMSESKQWYDTEDKSEQLIVVGYDQPEKDVCEYKDNSQLHSNMTSMNNEPDNRMRRVDSYEDKLHRINTELLHHDRYSMDSTFNERISSPSSDDSSSTVEGAAGGIPYNLILKDRWNQKQKKKKQINFSSDRRMRQLSKRNVKQMKQRSEYLKSPSSDTSDEDPKGQLHHPLETHHIPPRSTDIWNPESVLELNDQINEKLKLGEYHNDIRFSGRRLPPTRVLPIQNIRATQTFTSNQHNAARSNQELICSGQENRVGQQPEHNQITRRTQNRREQHDSQSQNRYVSGGARPKKL